MPKPSVREKFNQSALAAKSLGRCGYFELFQGRTQTEFESWRHLQSQTSEFTMKRLREPALPTQRSR